MAPRKFYQLSPWWPVVLFGEEAMIAEWQSYVVLPQPVLRF